MPKLLQNGKEITGASNDAALINYDNSASKLEATNIKDAIDEVAGNIEDVDAKIKDASTSQKGVVQLTSDLTGTSETLAATQKAVNSLNGTIASIPIVNNAGCHNSIYRGKNLGSAFTSTQKSAIANGTFEDLWIGDYWVIDGVAYRIAHFDYWLHSGDPECIKHHIVVVPDENLYRAKMNDTDITTGAYIGSKMYTENLEQAKTIIANAFGSTNILWHIEYLAYSTNATSGPVYELTCDRRHSSVELMNERMVYGADVYHNVEVNGAAPSNYTIDKSQLALFRLDPSRICNRTYWWLRDVTSSDQFANVDKTGGAGRLPSSSTFVGVRPVFGITG